MNLLYKLTLILSNNCDCSLTRLLENLVIKRLKSELVKMDYLKISPEIIPHYKMLVVVNQKNSQRNFRPKVIYYIYNTRLFKYAIFILNPLKMTDASNIYNYTRIKFLFFIVKNFKLINNAICQNIQIVNFSFENFSEFKMITSQDILNKVNVLEKYKNYSKFMFEPNWKIKIKNGSLNYDFSNLLLAKLIYWDSYRTLRFIKKFNLDSDCREFLYRYFPLLFESLQTFEKLSLQIMPNADLNSDDSFVKNIVQILNNSEVWNQSFIVKEKSLVIIDSTFIPKKEIASGLHGSMVRINGDSKNVLVRRSNSPLRNMENCIFLSYRVDTNYFHFLLDTLAKLMILNYLPDSIPLLIRDDLPSHFKNTIKSLTKKNLVEVSIDDVLHINELFVCTSVSSVFDFPTDNSINRINFPFESITKLRIQLLDNNKASMIKYDYVYINRAQSLTKNIVNNSSVISLLKEYNFSIIDMDEEFYKDQIQIFSTAKIVIASGGAVLANLIFINSNAKIVILESFFSHQLGLWRNLAEGLKVNANYVVGLRLSFRKKKNRIHSNYFVSVRKLRKIVEREITSVT